jgi:putative methyltransferase
MLSPPLTEALLTVHSGGFAHDEHIPDLLLFSPQTRFHEDPVYHTGKIILQDKASCFPATVLAPDAAVGDVIDATAAPGNKTSHLSALMHNKGKVCRMKI